MTRIHEAMKKIGRSTAEPQAVPMPPRAEIPLPTTVLVPMTPVPSAAEIRSAERFRETSWHPDPHRILFSSGDPYAPGTEAFRTLRSRLAHLRDKQSLHKVLVSSAVPGEGKTFVATNLAVALVQRRGTTVLLIDGDLRRSSVHELFGAPVAPGLTDYLLDEAAESDCIQKGAYDNLYLLAGGRAVANPADLLATNRLGQLLNKVAKSFDWIIVDSPPVVPFSDATVLMRHCDGVLLVVRAASTPWEMAQKARNEFRGASLLGAVLNGAEPGTVHGRGYDSYYGKGSTAVRKGDSK